MISSKDSMISSKDSIINVITSAKDSIINVITSAKDAVISAKESEINIRDALIANLNSTIAEKSDEVTKLKNDAFAVEMKSTAKEASRILMENSCRLYAGKKSLTFNTFSDRYEHFKDNEVLANSKLSAASSTYLQELAACKIDADPTQVMRELKGMMHILSRPFHVFPLSLDKGAYIGGDSLVSATLATCLLHLQKLNCCDYDVTVIDAQGKAKCLLSRGKITCL
jgi:hypothetical protein